MSYPISGLVKSYKAMQYEVEHPLVVRNCKNSVLFLMRNKETESAQVPSVCTWLPSCEAGKFYSNYVLFVC